MNGMALLASGTTSTGGMTEAVSSIMGIVSTVMNTITGNETLMAFFCAGIVFIAIGVVKRLRG